MDRSKRKLDHIAYALSTGQEGDNGLKDVAFIHNSIPLTALDNIDIQTKIGELSLSSPIFINAMTGGGGKKTYEINKKLATAAKSFNLAVSVGSQTAAIRDPAQRETYEVVREVNPNGIIFGNVGSDVTVDDAKRAVDMIEANALQVHVNVIQELVMPEGDRDFRQTLNTIENIVKEVDVPIIVKEVGFGMSKETVSSLMSIGVTAVDVGGFGGTNFSKIENKRRAKQLSFFNEWGIPTSISLLEANSVRENSICKIASGGMKQGVHVAKSIALGAQAVAFAGHFLDILMKEGVDGLKEEIEDLHMQLRLIMTAVGASTIEQLQHVPLMISGDTASWMKQRGIEITDYSLRNSMK